MRRLTRQPFASARIAGSSLRGRFYSYQDVQGPPLRRSLSTGTGANTTSSGLEVVSTKAGPPRMKMAGAPYSQAIKAGSQIWVSGQLPTDGNGKLIEGTVAEKTAQCCKNVIAVVEAGGSSVDKIVRVGVFLTDMSDFAEMNGEYAKWFKHKPARACVAVRQLPLGVPVEIEAIAVG